MRRPQSSVNTNPGPGNYNIKSFIENQNPISYTILGKKADIKDWSYLNPGPGSYKPLQTVSRPGSAKPKFGRQKRTFKFFESEDFPGPGEYS